MRGEKKEKKRDGGGSTSFYSFTVFHRDWKREKMDFSAGWRTVFNVVTEDRFRQSCQSMNSVFVSGTNAGLPLTAKGLVRRG